MLPTGCMAVDVLAPERSVPSYGGQTRVWGRSSMSRVGYEALLCRRSFASHLFTYLQRWALARHPIGAFSSNHRRAFRVRRCLGVLDGLRLDRAVAISWIATPRSTWPRVVKSITPNITRT